MSSHSNYTKGLPEGAIPYPDVSRIEVIGDGREYVTWDAKEVWIMLQDDGRTLKVFKKRPIREVLD